MVEKLKKRIERLKAKGYAVYLASKDKRTPWYAKMIIFIAIGYVMSPIDLIPDFIPVLGYLDDLLIVPLLLVFAIKMIPPDVLTEAIHKAENQRLNQKKQKNWIAAIIIVAIWIMSASFIIEWLWDK